MEPERDTYVVAKRVMLTREQAVRWNRLVQDLGQAMETSGGESPTGSDWARACIELLTASRERLMRAAADAPFLARPATGDSAAKHALELHMAAILRKALGAGDP